MPLLLVAVALAERGLGDSAALRANVLDWAATSGSPAAVRLLEDVLERLAARSPSAAPGIGLGAVGLLVGASGVFVEIEAALRRIFGTERAAKGARRLILGAVLRRLQAFAVVLATSLLVLATTALPSVVRLLLPDGSTAELVSGYATAALGFFTLSVGLALSYRLLPGRGPPWRSALRGALLAALLLSLARAPFAWAIVNLTRYSAYGVVGALLSALGWCYVASSILLLGACFAAPRLAERS